MIRCTVGVMAYNEERNISQALYALLEQRTSTCRIVEIVVVASGCTDRTVELAQAIADAHPLIRVEAQEQRLGKAAAINWLIERAQGKVIVLVGADTLPDPEAVEHLVQPFADPSVGMTGARVIPLNDPRTFLGYSVQLLWHVHHRMALRWPKLGELVAFRNIVQALPTDSATDEVALEAMITRQGHRLVYAPEARVYNRGPQTLTDFLLQRRRIFAGHMHIAATYDYLAASMPVGRLMRLLAEPVVHYPHMLLWTIGAALLEGFARMLGVLDVWFGQQHHIWRPALSSKQVTDAADSLTLVAFQCRQGSVQPADLMRRAQRIPPAHGALFWWDQRHDQVLFLAPHGHPGEAALEERIAAYATLLNQPNRSHSTTTLWYRVIQFCAINYCGGQGSGGGD